MDRQNSCEDRHSIRSTLFEYRHREHHSIFHESTRPTFAGLLSRIRRTPQCYQEHQIRTESW